MLRVLLCGAPVAESPLLLYVSALYRRIKEGVVNEAINLSLAWNRPDPEADCLRHFGLRTHARRRCDGPSPDARRALHRRPSVQQGRHAHRPDCPREPPQQLLPGLVIRHSFSNKPTGGYKGVVCHQRRTRIPAWRLLLIAFGRHSYARASGLHTE